MRDILEQSILALLREIELLISSLPEKIPAELAAYHSEISKSCFNLKQQALNSLSYLKKENESIFDDILSNTQKNTREFILYNSRLVTPLRRHLPSDELCLKILYWLHSIHPKIKNVPGAFIDGDVGIWASTDYPINYFMPTSAQFGLLYLPLFFHEFGHLLYAFHRSELDQLVIELQQEFSNILEPMSKRDDLKAQQDERIRKTIVETWFTWIQELFCDAVGFQIGGLCFVNAFSMYLKMWGSDRFNVTSEELAYSSHPVTWLRIKLLCEYLGQSGFEEYARKLENEWQRLAEVLSIKEDYFGFYSEEFLTPILKTIKDMLIETEPYRFKLDELAVDEIDDRIISPIKLLNTA